MNLENILSEWSTDCEIHHKLDDASRDTPKLHAKYLGYLAHAKLMLKRAEERQHLLLKDKWEWYNGKMCEERIRQLGWAADPFDGLKIMKGDMSYYYDSDTDIQESEAKVVYFNTMIETLKEIVETLRWRHQTIGNIIKWRQFESGN
jgi:hypothetical protein